MSVIKLPIFAYSIAGEAFCIAVDQWEGGVHLEAGIEKGYPSLTAEEARALAAILLHQAAEAER